MIVTLAEYYVSNYSKCTIDDSFLSSWQGLAYTTHAIQVFGFPMQLITFYLIINKSPKVMGMIKESLLFSHFWVTWCDVSLCALMTPYYFLPSVAGFNVGLLSYIGFPVHVQLFMICVSIFAMIIASLALFETRSSSIQENMFKIQRKRTRIAYYSFNFLLQTSVLIPMFSNIPENQELAKLQILESFPCPTREFFTSPTFVILTDPFWTNYILYFMTPVICITGVSQVAFFASTCIYYLYVAPTNATSSQTRKMQRRWFVGLLLQCSIPLTIFAIPYFVALAALVINRFTQTMMNSLVIVFGLHGIAESVSIIIVHKSYRQGFKQMFTRRKISGKNGQKLLRTIERSFRSFRNRSVF